MYKKKINGNPDAYLNVNIPRNMIKTCYSGFTKTKNAEI